ncbi:protein LLP homolog [Leptidea sinapis]|uniref:protein LLP homolog n=1 Tax=Leptidea sinapis TaxID=189913 RepID=UPI00212DF169|nr:protein LLP homolog [Leptidea sinapis]
MAKSLRSRWKRKCRAIKRERYAVKELTRLKKMLGLKEDKVTENEVMESDQVIFLDANQINKKKKEAEPEEDVEMSSDEENVEITDTKGARVFNSKTLKDQNGQYPVWLHKRKIAKLSNNKKKLKRKPKRKRYINKRK